MNEIVEYLPNMYATFWALIPPLVAIILALITKEVYSSLFIGIVMGGLFYGNLFQTGFSLEKSVLHIFDDGILGVLTDSYNVGILVFLVVLGIMVSMMNRAKLAYLIDATAAPVCIIAPISSWAAAVTGFVPGEDGFSIFINAIPYNYYALLTIVALLTFVILKIDFGPMAEHEANAANGDLYTTGDRPYENVSQDVIKGRGKVIDLIFPIVTLIICCVIGMIYTGGFFSGTGFIEAFSGSDASMGLMLGSFFALIITIAFYSVRRVLGFTECCNCIPEGFKAMVPAILILVFAWTLKSMTDSLGAKEYVASLVENISGPWLSLFPAIIFIIGALLAFATGTSWGTFGILIPIVVGTFSGINHTMMIISISACMAGAVCGDHCSPISDTTIMASAGAQCNHMNHVSTQLPYVMVVAVISCMTYILAGFIQSPVIPLIIGIVLMIGTLIGIKYITGVNSKKKEM